jgi:hypothetical protein
MPFIYRIHKCVIEDLFSSLRSKSKINNISAAFIEHRPSASSEHVATSHYVIVSNGVELALKFDTQHEAKQYACNSGYRPVLVARQRHLQNRAQPAQWKSDPC